eukprot:scaffold4096_cov237-Pinguiococcus_pyrenoidosus.AAC.8
MAVRGLGNGLDDARLARSRRPVQEHPQGVRDAALLVPAGVLDKEPHALLEGVQVLSKNIVHGLVRAEGHELELQERAQVLELPVLHGLDDLIEEVPAPSQAVGQVLLVAAHEVIHEASQLGKLVFIGEDLDRGKVALVRDAGRVHDAVDAVLQVELLVVDHFVGGHVSQVERTGLFGDEVVHGVVDHRGAVLAAVVVRGLLLAADGARMIERQGGLDVALHLEGDARRDLSEATLDKRVPCVLQLVQEEALHGRVVHHDLCGCEGAEDPREGLPVWVAQADARDNLRNVVCSVAVHLHLFRKGAPKWDMWRMNFRSYAIAMKTAYALKGVTDSKARVMDLMRSKYPLQENDYVLREIRGAVYPVDVFLVPVVDKLAQLDHLEMRNWEQGRREGELGHIFFRYDAHTVRVLYRAIAQKSLLTFSRSESESRSLFEKRPLLRLVLEPSGRRGMFLRFRAGRWEDLWEVFGVEHQGDEPVLPGRLSCLRVLSGEPRFPTTPPGKEADPLKIEDAKSVLESYTTKARLPFGGTRVPPYPLLSDTE